MVIALCWDERHVHENPIAWENKINLKFYYCGIIMSNILRALARWTSRFNHKLMPKPVMHLFIFVPIFQKTHSTHVFWRLMVRTDRCRTERNNKYVLLNMESSSMLTTMMSNHHQTLLEPSQSYSNHYEVF